MKTKLILMLSVAVMATARTPIIVGMKRVDIAYSIGVFGDSVYVENPSLTCDGKPILCHCGKRATCVEIKSGKIIGLCINHEEYSAVNPELQENWCTACGSVAGSKNIADLATPLSEKEAEKIVSNKK